MFFKQKELPQIIIAVVGVIYHIKSSVSRDLKKIEKFSKIVSDEKIMFGKFEFLSNFERVE